MKTHRRIARLYLMWMWNNNFAIPQKDIDKMEWRIKNSRPNKHSKASFDYRIRIAFADRHVLIKTYYDMIKKAFKTL